MVMDTDDRAATPYELDRMKELVATGMREGAAGMSSGLTYTPGMFASTDELVELCRVVAAYGGYYSPHQRSYGMGALEAYAEMIEVSRRSGCPLHLAHAVMNFAPNRGRGGELLALLDDALASGIDVTTDTYPYVSASTTLAALLPSWTAVGGPDAQLARLKTDRERIWYELEEVGTDGYHGCVADWSAVEISGVRNPLLTDAVGRNVAELARTGGVAPSQVFFDLLTGDQLATTILWHIGDEENVRTIMRHRTHCGGSDGILAGAKPHPRAWATFARYLGHYVRELGVLDLADCVHHLTGRPAARLRLVDRGLVREGCHADLVLFDSARVRDTATYDEPQQQPTGIEWVFVNGTAVIEAGARTDALPGRALRMTDGGTR
jgi:N-acyl-D-amino-acid deacylase